jgi:hypothetical protein
MDDRPLPEAAVANDPERSVVGGGIPHRPGASVSGEAGSPVPPAAGAAELAASLDRLERWGAARDWLGPDPYEGLNATRLGLLKRRPLGRRLLIQAVKRSPVDLRRPLGIEPRHNAAAIAQLLNAYSLLAEAGREGAAERAEWAVGRLAALRCAAYPEACWSYHFDVETRFFFYGERTPNTIATAFAGLALLEHADRVGAGAEAALGLATGAGEFFLRRVPRTEGEGGSYFGYLPDDRSPIHNANLLACSLLAALAARTGREDFAEAARSGVGYALAHQRPDGSWPYAEGERGGWVDGHHTGYVLDALLRCERALGAEPPIAAARRRGLDFYAARLIDADGAAGFYADELYPIDGQSLAQAMISFALAFEHDHDERDLELAWRVFGYAARRMQRSDGAFVFQKLRLWTNRVPHVRWVQAPMLEALARLQATAGGGPAG